MDDGQPTRQVRRAAGRADEKREVAVTKMAQNAEAVALGVDVAEKFQRMRHMFFAFVRSQGRIRIPSKDLNQLEERGRLEVKVSENGDLMVSYLANTDG